MKMKTGTDKKRAEKRSVIRPAVAGGGGGGGGEQGEEAPLVWY